MKMILIAVVALSVLGAGERRMENGFFRINVRGAKVTGLEIDPTGKGRYQPIGLIEMGYQGVEAGAAAPVVKATATSLELGGLEAETDTAIEVQNGGVPELLQPGHSLGQTFTVETGGVTRLEAAVPTWATTDSGATLALRKGGPDGEVVASRKIENAVDNAPQELTFAPQGPGVYCVELSDAKGQIGWWSGQDKRYAGGSAMRDGQPDATMERALKVFGWRPIGTAALTIELDGARLKTSVRVGAPEGARPLLMKVKWNNDGYDTSAAAVPFSRFFSDALRYMPTQQLKRWKERGGRYELGMGSERWIEAEGTGNCDLRFVGQRPSLNWQLDGKTTTLIVTPEAVRTGAGAETSVTLQALARRDSVPSEWPRFVTPNARDGEEASTFLWERAFSWGPLWGPALWHEWNNIARAWQSGQHLKDLASMLSTYPMNAEGYVKTWGDAEGWPFPDNARFDTRHSDTNAKYILGCKLYAAWTGDTAFLKGQAERMRKAMEYQLTVMHGEDGLIIAQSKDVTGRHRGVGDNYWDVLPFGHLDAYVNAAWYGSIEAMAQIEEMLADAGGVKTTVAARSPEEYRRLREKVKQAYNDTFWDDTAGRYIGCVDIDGKRHDYGFTFVNVEAMAYGLATPEQAKRIYHWMETEPTSTGKADTYSAYIFAPRANTLHNPMWDPEHGKIEDVPQEPWWFDGWRGTHYGDVQCQDGGAILYTSYFDLMARAKLMGADNAWRRWTAIVGRWRMPDHLVGGPPLFRGEHPQQINPGAVGTDIPFPESGMVPCWLLYGVAGVEPTSKGLVIAPRLPKGLPWLEIRNMTYHGLVMTLRVTRDEVRLRWKAEGREQEWREKLGADGQAVYRAER